MIFLLSQERIPEGSPLDNGKNLATGLETIGRAGLNPAPIEIEKLAHVIPLFLLSIWDRLREEESSSRLSVSDVPLSPHDTIAGILITIE